MKSDQKAIRKVNKPAYNNIIIAFHNAIKYHPGGFELFAKTYNRNASTVRNQFNVNHDNQLTFQLFLEAIEYLGGEPVAMNSLCILGNGHYVADCDCDTDGDLPDEIMVLLAQAGEMVHECATSLTDGRISSAEKINIREKASALQTALNSLYSSLARGDL